MKRVFVFILIACSFAALDVARAQSDETYYYENSDWQTYLPGTRAKFAFLTRERGTQNGLITLYRVPARAQAEFATHFRWRLGAGDLAKCELLRSQQVSPQTTGDGSTQYVTDFGALAAGRYFATFKMKDVLESQTLQISDLGTLWHSDGAGTLLAYAIDLRNFRALSGVRYTLASRDTTPASGSSRDGLATFYNQKFKNSVLIGEAPDGSTTVMRVQGDLSNGAAFLQTDRPVYRQGQRVFLRAILREGFIGNYKVPSGARKLEIRAPDGSVVFSELVRLSKFGTAHADFSLEPSAALGSYQVALANARTSFDVEAYKKPEYVIDASAQAPFVIGGDEASFDVNAKYFFGQAAAGMHIHYRSSQQERYWWGDYNPYRGFYDWHSDDNHPITREGEGQTDTLGHYHFTIATKHRDVEEQLETSVEARDHSGRTVSLQRALRVVPASFYIAAEPRSWFVTLGKTAQIDVATRDYHEHVRSGVPIDVHVIGTDYDRKTYKPISVEDFHRIIRTGTTGKAIFTFEPRKSASYEVSFSGKDERGYFANTQRWFWVCSQSDFWVPNERLTIVPQKESYAPGAPAKVLITTPEADADALVLVESDRINSARVVRVGPRPRIVTIVPPKDASQYRVVVEVPSKDGVNTATAQLKVKPPSRALQVNVTWDRSKYLPGQPAHVFVRVAGRDGQPVSADVSLDVVDEALYAVEEDHRPSVDATFYDNRSGYIQTGQSWYRVMQLREISRVASASSDVYSVNASSQGEISALGGGSNLNSAYSAIASGVKLRQRFEDTAYWIPDAVTDDNGKAELDFRWPDNLTTWRATTSAVTHDTSVGLASAEALVTKDFLVRLEIPRFLRRGDRSRFIGMANSTHGAASAHLALDAGDLTNDAQTQELTLNEAGSGDVFWNVHPVTSLGQRSIRLAGRSGSFADALQLDIPIEAAGAAEHVRDAGEVHDRNSFSLALPTMYDSGDLQLSLAPSAVAGLLHDVYLLDVYPYYCTEQTMSAALPAIFMQRLSQRSGLGLPQGFSPKDVTAHAIERLGELQHSSGGWGWWETDDDHPFMTAYALYGLSQMRLAGYRVPDSMYGRGVDSLVRQLATSNDDTLRLWGGRQPHSQWNTRAFMLFALASAAPSRIAPAYLEQTYAHARELNPYALSVLGLAEHTLGHEDRARAILAALNEREITDGPYTYWLGQTWEYSWEDDPIETTAYALRLNAAIDPRSPRVGRIISFLRSQEHGGWWFTTKDTAAAIYAMADALDVSRDEFHPNEDVTVYVGNQTVAHRHINRAVPDADQTQIRISAAQLQNGGTVRVSVAGTGSLYWSSDWTRYAPPYARKVQDASESILARLRARAPSFSIERRYEAPHTPWQVGDEVSVDLVVRSDRDVDYVAVEDPFPAGVEYQTLQGAGDQQNWSGMQFLDNRATFFTDRMSGQWPLHLHYSLRVTTPGTYTAAPPTAYAMYGPPVSTVGQPDVVVVR